MTLEAKRQAAITFVERLTNADFSGVPIDSEFRAITPSTGEVDLAAYIQAAYRVTGAAPDGMTFKITGSTAEGDRVAIEASNHAMLNTGKVYDQKYHFAFEFRNDRIYRLRTYADTKMVADILRPAMANAAAKQ